MVCCDLLCFVLCWVVLCFVLLVLCDVCCCVVVGFELFCGVSIRFVWVSFLVFGVAFCFGQYCVDALRLCCLCCLVVLRAVVLFLLLRFVVVCCSCRVVLFCFVLLEVLCLGLV